MAAVDDDDLMVLVEEALHRGLRRPRDVAPEPSAVARPPEGITLAVLLGKHQKDLRRQEGIVEDPGIFVKVFVNIRT